MRKIILSLLVLCSVAGAGAAYALLVHIPDLAQHALEQTLAKTGIDVPHLDKPEISYNGLTYTNLNLDAQNFSTVERLEISYDPIKILTSKTIKSISLSGLNLTGELTQNNMIAVAGWDAGRIHEVYENFALDKFEIRDSRLSLLTQQFGGVSLSYDIDFQRKERVIEFQGRIKTKQNKLDFSADLSGNINEFGQSQGIINIEKAKFDTPNIKATRLTGQVKFTQPPTKAMQILCNFEAGGLSLGGVAWQNASGGLEGNINDYKALINATSVGADNVEISLSAEKAGGNDNISGSLHAVTLKNLLAYFQSQGFIPKEKNISPNFDNMPGASISFQIVKSREQAPKDIIYNINIEEKDIDIKGKSTITENGTRATILASTPMPLKALDPSFFTAGTVAFSGESTTKEKKFTAQLKANIKNAIYKSELVKLKNISGTMVLDEPLSLSTKTPQSLSCKTNIALKHKCTLDVSLLSGALNFNALTLKLLGGTLSTQNFNPLKNGDEWVFEAKNIDLSQLLKALKLDNISASGRANATIFITKKQDRLFIRRATITNKGAGKLKYQHDGKASIFEGDEFELKNIYIALQNYHFDTMDIQMSGPIGGPIDVAIKTNGKNPDLFGPRNIALNLKAQTTLRSLFKNMDED